MKKIPTKIETQEAVTGKQLFYGEWRLTQTVFWG